MSRPVPASSTPFIAGPADLPILTALGRYYYLTASQVTRLLYARSSQTYAQARLKRLADHGYLQRIFLPRPSRTGSAPLVYTLARKGLSVLAAWGRDVDRRYRPVEVRETSYLYLAHTLALNDVLIALELLCRHDRRVQLAGLRHERDLKLRPVRVRLPDGVTAGVIPDAWVDLRIMRRCRECYAVELDRGTTEQKAWRRKVAALMAYANGPYQEAFGTASLTIVVVATPGAGRRDQLIRWTEAELAAAGRAEQSGLFRFTGVPVAETSPEMIFMGAGWRRPFDRQSRPLLDLSDTSPLSDSSETSETSENSEQAGLRIPLAATRAVRHSTLEVVDG